MVSLDTGWKEKAECGCYKRGTGPMRKKSSRRGGKWRLLSKKGRRFVLPPEIDGGGSAAATMVGYAWTARGGWERQWRGREPNHKVRSSSASTDVDVKKHEQGAAAHTPEVRSGRSRVGVGWVHNSTRYRTPTSFEGRREESPTEERLCGKISHIISS
jgi:hypothetical protein